MISNQNSSRGGYDITKNILLLGPDFRVFGEISPKTQGRKLPTVLLNPDFLGITTLPDDSQMNEEVQKRIEKRFGDPKKLKVIPEYQKRFQELADGTFVSADFEHYEPNCGDHQYVVKSGRLILFQNLFGDHCLPFEFQTPTNLPLILNFETRSWFDVKKYSTLFTVRQIRIGKMWIFFGTVVIPEEDFGGGKKILMFFSYDYSKKIARMKANKFLSETETVMVNTYDPEKSHHLSEFLVDDDLFESSDGVDELNEFLGRESSDYEVLPMMPPFSEFSTCYSRTKVLSD